VDGAYHHHQNPVSLRAQLGDEGAGHSPILGWAFDGYPIYGPYGYANSDGTGGIVRVESSYRLKSGTRPSGPGGSYDGAYIEDYEFVSGSGFLDEHNGRFSITPEYPQGTYHYVATIGADGKAAYPYAIGPTYFGVVETANFSQTVTVPETATQYDDPRMIVNVAAGASVIDTATYTGNEVIAKRGGGTLILNKVNSHSGGLEADAGSVQVENEGALNGGPLLIQPGAGVAFDVSSTVLDVAAIDVPALAHLDVGTGGVRVASGGFDAASIRQALTVGRNNGAWNATSGITFTEPAAATTTLSLAVGYLIDASGVLTVRCTPAGDADLDGQVDFDDILALFPNYGATGSFTWQEGDFTYDGKVDFDDILELFPNYGAAGLFGAAGAGAGLLGGGGGSGVAAGAGDSSTGTVGMGTGAGTADSRDGANTAGVMGPEPAADMPRGTVTMLTRTDQASETRTQDTSLDATSLAFAGLAGTFASSGKKDDGSHLASLLVVGLKR
jgi:autotransporter-associated beta strand protein